MIDFLPIKGTNTFERLRYCSFSDSIWPVIRQSYLWSSTGENDPEELSMHSVKTAILSQEATSKRLSEDHICADQGLRDRGDFMDALGISGKCIEFDVIIVNCMVDSL